MIDTFQRAPRLGAAILWAASRDAAMVVEHLVNIGRRSALLRTAHLLLELGLRLQLVGLGSDRGFACPLNQHHLADALGLTAIHVNRVLRQLRERRPATFRDGRVEFHDLKNLRDLAEYHSGYLDQTLPPPSPDSRAPGGHRHPRLDQPPTCALAPSATPMNDPG